MDGSEYYYARGIIKSGFLCHTRYSSWQMDSGIMTISRLKANSAKRVSLPVSFTWPVRTVSPQAPPTYIQNYVMRTSVYINLHLEDKDKGAGKRHRPRALNRILKQEAAKGNYVIAAGDFNQTFNNVGYKRI